MSDTKQADGDAPDVWSSEDAPGGYVCSVCRTPVESEPCPEHQPARYAAMDGDEFGRYGDGQGVELARTYLARHGSNLGADVATPPVESMTARLYALADRWSPTTDMSSSRVRARFECAEDIRLALAGRCRDECSEQHTYEPGVCEAATPPPPPGVSEQDDRHTSAGDLGLCHGVDSCVHGRSVWSCPLCDAGQLSELVALWGRDRAAAASCRRSVRMVWPELGERLDDLLDQQDGGTPDV